MSEHITHLAVAEDSKRIASLDPNFSKTIQSCIDKYPLAYRLGSTTRSGDKFILPLLEKWRDDWKKDDPRSEKLAYILGWSGHLAADRIFKPVYRITNLDYYLAGKKTPTDASVYHDALTFGLVYKHGKEEPFHPTALQTDLKGHPAADYVPVSRIEHAYSGSLGANIATIKKFLPDKVELVKEEWEHIETERQMFYVDLDRYTKAYYHGDPALLRQFITEPHFYNPEDPIIQLARSVQENKPSNIDLKDALDQAGNQSLYAQSLKLGHQFLMADSDFFEKKISMEEAGKRHRRGKRHKEKLQYYIDLAEGKEGK